MALQSASITIHGVQFVGTNVEMTYTIDPELAGLDEAEVEAALNELLAANLRLHAITRTGTLESKPRFSVMASPLERLFHKIGPATELTLIKHASMTLDLSDVNLVRQGEGLMRTYPSPNDIGDFLSEVWTPWDAGKLIGIVLRKPEFLDLGKLHVAGAALEKDHFPQAILPNLQDHVQAHDGVQIVMPTALRPALQSTSPA